MTGARNESGTLTNAVRIFVERHRIAHLATADAAGGPHVIPICYALLGQHFYFVTDDKPKRTRTGLKRLRNIAENPQVAFVIDEYDDDWSRLAYLLVQGRATLVDSRQEYGRALVALRARYAQYQAMALLIDTHPMIRIAPQRLHWWQARASDAVEPC